MVQKACRATILDVAKAAGVSASTVSHALSGKRPISAEVCERIRKIIGELGYRPNAAARSMVLKKTMQVGIVIDEIANSISGALVEAMAASLRRRDYKLLLGICGWSEDAALGHLRNFSAGMVDGIINMVGGLDGVRARSECRGLPLVNYLRDNDSPVSFDKFAGATLVMNHLWSLGHRKIGYLASHRQDGKLEEREDGYVRFMKERKGGIAAGWLREGDDCPGSGFSLAPELMREGVSAIFAANDMMAVGVLQWAYAAGVRVPQDLSVVGFDDAPVAQAVVPALTSVRMPVGELAEKTVAGLMRLMRGEALPETEILPAELVVRSSSAPFMRQR